MLNDQFGRQFNYLRLSITDVCNFSCTYCLPNGYQCDTPRNFLNKNEINTLVNVFAQLGTNAFTIVFVAVISSAQKDISLEWINHLFAKPLITFSQLQ